MPATADMLVPLAQFLDDVIDSRVVPTTDLTVFPHLQLGLRLSMLTPHAARLHAAYLGDQFARAGVAQFAIVMDVALEDFADAANDLHLMVDEWERQAYPAA